MRKWTTHDMPDQSGRIAIVTGANSGLGYYTTLELARKGATVVMACRNQTKGQQALDEVKRQLPEADLDLMALDLSKLTSVREFAAAFKAKYDRLDLLINNAGVMAIPHQETEDGFEMQFAINHLGPFALTGLLLETLAATPNSRVVTVSSFANYTGTIDFDDINHAQRYTRYGAYGQSKLANVLFGFELQRRLEAAGINAASIVAHPGYSATNLQHTSTSSSDAKLEGALYNFLNRYVAQPAEMGVLPQLYAATAPDAEGGMFYGPKYIVRGYPNDARAKREAYDRSVARRLWEVSEQMTGVKYHFEQPSTVQT